VPVVVSVLPPGTNIDVVGLIIAEVLRSLASSQERGPSGLSATPGAQSNKFKKNTSLKPEISELEVLYEVSLTPAGTKFVESLMKNLTCFLIALRDEWDEIFVVMVELGFFRRTGDRLPDHHFFPSHVILSR
jgi:hypothetical protein